MSNKTQSVTSLRNPELGTIMIFINDVLHISANLLETSVFSWIDEQAEFKHKIQFVVKNSNEKIVMEYEDVILWKDILYHITKATHS